MTKRRPALTFDNALFKLLGAIGVERAVAVTGRSADYIYALSNPDRRERLTLDDAIELELAHLAAGGTDLPIFETYGLRLKARQAEDFADASAIARQLVTVLREAGEAHAALAVASAPGATDHDFRDALHQAEEASQALSCAICLVSKRLAAPPAQPP